MLTIYTKTGNEVRKVVPPTMPIVPPDELPLVDDINVRWPLLIDYQNFCLAHSVETHCTLDSDCLIISISTFFQINKATAELMVMSWMAHNPNAPTC